MNPSVKNERIINIFYEKKYEKYKTKIIKGKSIFRYKSGISSKRKEEEDDTN